MKLSQLSLFAREALGTLLWSETDEDGSDCPPPFLCDIGAHYASGLDVPCEDFDFDEDGLAEFARECDSFAEEVAEAGLSDVLRPDQIASDFILTRNRHGAGFWDRGIGEAGTRLTKMAKVYGTVGLYRGDDGRLYFHG